MEDPIEKPIHLLISQQIGLLADYLWGNYPEVYHDRPTAPHPTFCRTKRARIRVMMLRVEAGYSPFHPNDGRLDDCDHVGQLMMRTRNGRDTFGDLLVGVIGHDDKA